MKILRIFPRRTKATPVDEDVRVGEPPGLFDKADEVHISVTFTWDLPLAEQLARQWEHIAPVKIGGPATGMRGEEFVPGCYLKPGYVITSRGCPNRCWFCSVRGREGTVRELPITDGWNVQDDNLLACSRQHIEAVFAMLKKQRHAPEFAGGLEASKLEPWHAVELKGLHTKQVFFAYDSGADLGPLRDAASTMRAAGFTEQSKSLRCYVLCGYKKSDGAPMDDTIEDATRRMLAVLDAGFVPHAQVFRGQNGHRDPAWLPFQKTWSRPASIYRIKKDREAAMMAKEAQS